MKVGIQLSGFTPDSGGGYTFESELLNSLLHYQEKSNHTFVIVSHLEKLTQEINSRQSSTIKAFFSQPPSILDKLYNFFFGSIFPRFQFLKSIDEIESTTTRIFKKIKIEIIISLGPNCTITDIPYLVIVWDLQHRLQPWFPEVHNSGEWNNRELYYSKTLKQASFVITGTLAGKSEIMHFYGVPEQNIRILPHPTSQFALEKTENDVDIFKKFDLPRQYLFYPAQFWPHKNHLNLVYALKILIEKYNLRLPIVFVGSDKGNLSYVKKIVETLQLTDEVLFLGFVPIEDLKLLYKNALMLTYVTFFGPENLPPLEAFALGCPVIASKVSGAEEQLGDAALLVDPKSPEQIAEAIFNLYNSPDLRKTLIERGEKRAQKWTPKDFIRGILTILDEFEAIRKCWE